MRSHETIIKGQWEPQNFVHIHLNIPKFLQLFSEERFRGSKA